MPSEIIWDACSDMTNYVYFNFDETAPEFLKILFSDDGDLSISEFSQIPPKIDEDKKETMVNILDEHKIPTGFPKEKRNSKEKFISIIDFPNFLLQVLKLKNKNVSLNDKKLLEEFKKSEPNPREFIFDLLKYRTLFDKYVIKQSLTLNNDENKQN